MNQSIISSAHGTLILWLYILFFFSQVAELLGPGHVITTCLCDTGQVGCRRFHVLFLVTSSSRRLNDSHLFSGRNISAVSSVGTGWSLKVSQVPKKNRFYANTIFFNSCSITL